MTPELITFDIFGTVLDWKSGLIAACTAEGRELSDEDFDRVIAVQSEIEHGAFTTYREVTSLSLQRALALEVPVADRIADGIGTWPLFTDSQKALQALLAVAPCAAMTNSDIVHGEQIQHRLGFRLSDWFCAEESRVYKPDPRFWHLMAQRRGILPGRSWWHVSAYADYDLAVANSLGLTTIFVQRPHSRPAPAAHSVSSLHELVLLLS